MTSQNLLTSLAVCLVRFSTIAQPVLDFDVEPQLGNKMDYLGTYTTAFTDPGGAGPNQNWELPYPPASFANLKQTCIQVAGTPFAAQYPGAQYCVRTLIQDSPTKFAYYSKTDTSVQLLGQAFLGNVVYKNTKPAEQVYPLHFGDIKNKQFEGTLKIGTQTTYYHTRFQQQYDGYGALQLGADFYPLAMRVKTLLTRVDSLPAANGAYKQTILKEESYQWFVEDTPGYVGFLSTANTIQMTIAANGDTSQFQQFPPVFSSEWQLGVSVGATEAYLKSEAHLFDFEGNLVQERLRILPLWQDNQPVVLKILNMEGKTLYSATISNAEEKIDIEVGAFPSGMYLLNYQTASGIQVGKWMKL